MRKCNVCIVTDEFDSVGLVDNCVAIDFNGEIGRPGNKFCNFKIEIITFAVERSGN